MYFIEYYCILSRYLFNTPTLHDIFFNYVKLCWKPILLPDSHRVVFSEKDCYLVTVLVFINLTLLLRIS